MKKYIPLFLFVSLLLFTLLLLRFLPSFQLNAQEAGTISLVDFALSKETINTDAGADQIILYVRASTTAPEGELSLSTSIAPLAGCSDEGDCWQPQAQSSYMSLMTEGCDSLPVGFDIDGLTGCGDRTDGVFSIAFDMPQYSKLGDWIVYDISMNDGSTTSNTTFQVSLDTGIFVTENGNRNAIFANEGVLEDVEAPEIVSFAFDKESIDTTLASESLTLYMRISDNLTGVDDEFAIGIGFSPDDDPGYAMTEGVNFELSLLTVGCDSLPAGLDVEGLAGGCGDVLDGIYAGTVSIPRYSTGGIWRVSNVGNLNDLLGNAVEEFLATFTNTSTEFDLTAPELKGVTITPSVFNTASSSQVVTFELEIEDDLAGVDQISILVSPILSGADTVALSEYTITEGNSLDGKFEFELTLPQGSPSGFWRINNIDVGDALNREQRYTTSRLALLFPDVPLYLLNQGTSESVELGGAWTLEDWPYYDGETVVWPDISVRFQEGTVITKKTGGVFAFHRMLATKYSLESATALNTLLGTVNADHQRNLEDCDVSEGCIASSVTNDRIVGTPLHIIKMGIPGLNLEFSKPVTVIIGVEPEYLGSTFLIQSYDEINGVWIDHGTCTVQMIVPESTEHGGDAYGITKPVAYAGCSFTTDHASFFSANILGATNEAGVPNTGVGGAFNYYTRWLR